MADFASGRMRDRSMKPELAVLPRKECPDRSARAQGRAGSDKGAMLTAGLVARSICNVLPAGVGWAKRQVVRPRAFGVGRSVWRPAGKMWLPAEEGIAKQAALQLMTDLIPRDSVQTCMTGDMSSWAYFAD